MNNLIKLISTSNKIFKINDNLYEIKIDAKINVGINIKIYLEQTNNEFRLTDKKNILKNMNEIYELNSKDVQKCMSDILKLYGFQLSKGEIFCNVTENNLMQQFYNLIMCYAQLLNMFIFFDEPN